MPYDIVSYSEKISINLPNYAHSDVIYSSKSLYLVSSKYTNLLVAIRLLIVHQRKSRFIFFS